MTKKNKTAKDFKNMPEGECSLGLGYVTPNLGEKNRIMDEHRSSIKASKKTIHTKGIMKNLKKETSKKKVVTATEKKQVIKN